jgi:branched-chain amino acid transport system substrate-binding protein
MRRTAVLALAFALVIAVMPRPGSSADPYVIDAIVAQTGSESFLGREQAQTLGIIEGIVNKTGGIGGRPVKFVVHDDQSSPQLAVQLTNAAIARNAAVIIGSTAVALCNAMAPLAKEGPIVYCLSPGIHPPDGSFVFSAGVSTADTLGGGIRFLAERGWKKIAVITSIDATGQDADRIVDSALAAQPGMTIVAREHFNTSDVSVSAQMAHVKASEAQALIAWSTGSAFGTLMRGATESGVTVPIVTSAGNMTYAQMKAYAAFLPRDLYFPASPAYVPDVLPNGPVKRAVIGFDEAMTAAGVKPDNGYMLCWDSTFVLIDALRKLGTNAGAAQIRDEIEGVRNLPGILGMHDFRTSAQRGLGAGSVVMARWDAAKETWVGVPGGAAR